MDELTLKPIGYLHCQQLYTYDAPRQSTLANENEGFIELNSKCNFEQALEDLEGFDKIWIIYQFHKNSEWKPKTPPPRTNNDKKKGVFATRSPYRPNPIGLSCVDLIRIKGLKVFIKNFDLINNTPILDIKPYIPYCDSFTNSKAGWIDEIELSDNWKCIYTETAEKQLDWISKNSTFNIKRFCKIQLSNDPLNKKKKRLETVDTKNNIYCLSYRTWRILFKVLSPQNIIEITEIRSGYSKEDLQNRTVDKYKDKKIHELYNLFFCHPTSLNNY